MTDLTEPSTVTWRKSSFSNGGGECVEIAVLKNSVAARDSKAPEEGMLVLPRAGFASLIRNLADA